MLARVLVAQTKLPVSTKLFAVIATTDSLNVKANVVPAVLLLTFKNEFASLDQVRTGGVVSGIVVVVVADAAAMVPEIPLWPRILKVPDFVRVTAALVPCATLLVTVIVQTVLEV